MVKQKILAAALAAACLLSATACSSNNSSSSSGSTSSGSHSQSAGGDSSSNSSEQGDGSLPILKVGINQSPNIQNLDTNYLTLWLEEKMNCDIQFEIFPASGDDYRTKFAMLVTSNAQLPDVMATGLGNTANEDYIAKGIFIPLDEYFADPEMTPNFHSLDADVQQFMLTGLKQSNGQVYSFFSYNNMIWNEYYHRAFINKEWLEALNLTAPTTTDELTEVLRAFVTQDPNGNGKADEIGLIGAKDGGYGQEPLPYIMSAFTQVDYGHNYLNVKDGKVYASYTTPEWKQGIEYMNMLVNEGLMSPLSFTQDYQQLKAMGTSEEAIAGILTCGSASNFGASTDASYLRMSLLEPLTGPNGVKTAVFSPNVPSKTWFITKDCSNVELAVKMGDLFLSEEGSMTARYGEKGVDWTDDPDVVSLYHSDYEFVGLDAKYAVDLDGNLWANPQNKHWYGATPKYEPYYQYSKGNVLKTDFENNTTGAEDFTSKHYTSYQLEPSEFIYMLPYTTEELEQISVEKTAIDQYVVDQSAAFITGTRSMSEWDSFISELEGMGLEKYLQAAQAAYDRSNS